MLTEPDDVFQVLEDTLTAAKTSLGLKEVTFGDLKRAVNGGFPCAWIVPGPTERVPYGSGREVSLEFRAFIYVMHADMTQSRPVRTHKDLQLAALVRNALGYGLSGNLPGSWVSSETPRSVPYRQGKMVISTELLWVGISRGILNV